MDRGAVDVIIHITAQINVLSFIASLDLPTLLAETQTRQNHRLLEARYVYLTETVAKTLETLPKLGKLIQLCEVGILLGYIKKNCA